MKHHGDLIMLITLIKT